MKDHECDRCGRCCTVTDIPVTIGDIYRIKSEYRASMKMYAFFQEITDGWMVAPSDEPGVYWPIPKAKKPCLFLGEDDSGHVCTIYDTRFVLCGGFPDEYLLGPPEGHEDSEGLVKFHESLDCMKGVGLTPERRERAEAIRKLFNDEIEVTSKLLIPVGSRERLHPRMLNVEVPIRAYSTMEINRKLSRMTPGLNFQMRFMLTKKENIRIVRKNLSDNGLLDRYRELYPIDW